VDDVLNQVAIMGARSKGQDRAICLTENLFCNAAQKQLGDAVSSMCADDKEIRPG